MDMFFVLTLNTFFFSSEDFPSSGVLLQRSDEATEEKAVFDTFLAGRSPAARETEKTFHLFFWYQLNRLVSLITPRLAYGSKHD